METYSRKRKARGKLEVVRTTATNREESKSSVKALCTTKRIR